ncbi:hypothetical protein B1R94_27725 [Mycolicibacterium litorale]|nr:hypothetical protein B1R94_27725 [Mycolicibacterium litorale]
MLDPGWTIRTPEENALIFEVAPGPAATIANGLAWSAEAANIAASVAVSAVNTVGTLAEWQGAGAVASGTSATMLNTSDTLRQSWAEAKVPIAAAAVDAFGAARSAVIPSAVSTENRTECAFDIGINPLTLWQLSPRIAELELEYYGEHWPQNTSVGLAYAAALSALTAALAVPPPLAPMAASPGAPAAAAAAVSQSAVTDGASVAMRESAQAAQSATQGASQAAGAPSDMASQMSSMMQPVQSLTQMVPQALQAFPQAFQGLASMPQSMMGSLGGMFGSMKPTDAAVDAGLAQRVSAVSAAGVPAVGVRASVAVAVESAAIRVPV